MAIAFSGGSVKVGGQIVTAETKADDAFKGICRANDSHPAEVVGARRRAMMTRIGKKLVDKAIN